jgi:ABC-type transporter Mla subunit MlaD
MKEANLIRVTAVGRIRSAIVVSGQLQDDARERITQAQAQLAEGIADLERALATEANLHDQLERALAIQADLRAQLQCAEEV